MERSNIVNALPINCNTLPVAKGPGKRGTYVLNSDNRGCQSLGLVD
jgi:hypothetical protein